MKLHRQIFILALCAVLLLCASCAPVADGTPTATPSQSPVATAPPEGEPSPTLSPEPTPESTPEPTPELTPEPTPEPTTPPGPWSDDPGQFIQYCLDEDFAVGPLWLNLVFDGGSMPRSNLMYEDETGQAIRELFASYEWELTEKPKYEEPEDGVYVPDISDLFNFSLSLGLSYRGGDDGPWYLSLSSDSDVLHVTVPNYQMHLYFRAEGAEELARKLVALSPDPDLHTFLADSPLEEDAEDTLQQYMDGLFASLTENGHITDYELVSATVKDAEKLRFEVKFRVKPTHPELKFWQDGGSFEMTSSGWTKTVERSFWLETDGELCHFCI